MKNFISELLLALSVALGFCALLALTSPAITDWVIGALICLTTGYVLKEK